MSLKRASPEYVEFRESLPIELRPVFDQPVEEGHFHTIAHFRRGYVACKVLASLVRDGWRPFGEPQTNSSTENP